MDLRTFFPPGVTQITSRLRNHRYLVPMKRDIIEINEELCIGCGSCVPQCHQGALQIIEGKARLISDLMCEGIGACVGSCPTGAMTVEQREAEPYDEGKVLKKLAPAGPKVLQAHLEHLKEHGQQAYLAEALAWLEAQGIENPLEKTPVSPAPAASPAGGGFSCPGSRVRKGKPQDQPPPSPSGPAPSALRQWPVQLHLLHPSAEYLQGADLLLAADCTACAAGDFHSRFLAGKALAIACPKLDTGLEGYREKLTAMINSSRLNTLTVLMMEVPCCGGLLRTAQQAAAQAERKVPIKAVVLSTAGEVLQEDWV